MATTSNMFMYSLTIQPPTHITQAVLGQFSGTKEQQIATASGSTLTLLRPDPILGKVVTLLSHDVFGIIRGLAAFRLAGSNKDYSEADQDPTGHALDEYETQLVYYELDLGLNHVVRKWSDAVDPTASLLFQVPGGNDGPSGVLVCGQENITYRHSNQEAFRVPIPRRKGATEDPSRKRSIAAGVMHKLKGNVGAFFFLLQTDDGDLFKVTLDMVEDDEGNATGEVKRIKIKYFDTIPLSTSLCILKSGFLFAATQSGNHQFYQFEKLGDDDNELEFSSDSFPTDPKASYEAVYFNVRPLENMALVESIDSMNPLMDCKVANLTGEDAPQIYAACGTGARSTFRSIKYGLEVSEIVASELPGVPSAVWTLKLNRSDKYDAYIVLSFANGTLVLSIGETVEEVSDSGFLTSVPTLAAQLLGENGLIQVHPKGIRHIINGEVNEWAAPQHRSIVSAATNDSQVAIALSSGEIVYFEMDTDGSLAEYDEKKEMPGTVTIFSIDKLGDTLIQRSTMLTYTPRKLVKHPELPMFYTVESENNTLAPDLRQQLIAAGTEAGVESEVLPPADFGYPKGRGRWASCISVIDPLGDEFEPQVLQTVDFSNNEAATSATIAPFTSQDNENFLIVGSGKDIKLNPRTSTEGYIHVYRFLNDGRELEFIHTTKVEEPPTAMIPFQGRLLVGIGKVLRIYDLGMKQMLRKCQVDLGGHLITTLDSRGSRITVGDVMQGMTFVVYKTGSNKLIPFADDSINRWSTCSALVDYESVAGGDKFGNFWIVRAPVKDSEEADEDPSGTHLLHTRGYLHGTPARLSCMVHFYTQDPPTSITKTSLVVGGQDVILWSGLMGTIGVFIPFVSREDVDFFQALETHMRTEDPPLAGRDHLIYRGYYVPAKGVIDGDLCERFALLSNDKKQMIAGELDRSNQEAAEKLDRNIYDYDAVYDSLKPPPKTKSAQDEEEDARPRYMTGIVAAAAVRKRDAMAAEQVKVDRDREAEGDEFADKDVFVTAAYKKQQEEKKKMDAELAKIEAAEAEKRKGGGGMTDFYKKVLKDKEDEHNAIMRAAELRSKMTPEERAREDALREQAREKTDEERAKEINAKGGNIVLNDDGQIVDKRQMLHGGLNVLSTRKKDAAHETKSRERAPELGRKGGVFGPGGRQAQRERQSKMIEEQLAESLKRAREEEEEERQKIETMNKSRKTAADVSSAKERYLARKKAAEEAKKKDKGTVM
ncbi:Pre-mRNA-splicing factor rse-1 [Ceratocystis platani]|uniref:Pre-mRNA-splicing factor rse-1 n=1 Tax=Ceratocystis fimbriata f. sp. platani TaxID=88771 RepID=A0A0F8B2I4_CERFI|nr:Pre-mRNA-splicing factor rse-1 [Ceratocystis platani]